MLIALVDEAEDHEARMTAVAFDHAQDFFAHQRVREIIAGRFIAARLLVIKQAQFIRLVQHQRLADGAVKIEHVHAEILRVPDLLFGEFRRWNDSADGPEAPTDRRAQDDAPAIEPEHGVAAEPFRREPAEAKCLGNAVSRSETHFARVKIRVFQAPQFRVRNGNFLRHHVFTRVQFHPGRAQ